MHYLFFDLISSIRWQWTMTQQQSSAHQESLASAQPTVTLIWPRPTPVLTSLSVISQGRPPLDSLSSAPIRRVVTSFTHQGGSQIYRCWWWIMMVSLWHWLGLQSETNWILAEVCVLIFLCPVWFYYYHATLICSVIISHCLFLRFLKLKISASSYELRYAMSFEDLDSDFNNATIITNSIVVSGGNLNRPQRAGTVEEFVIQLPENGQYIPSWYMFTWRCL